MLLKHWDYCIPNRFFADTYFPKENMYGILLPHVMDRAYETLVAHFDEVCGGFGLSPKFPTPHNLSFLLRYNKLKKQDYAVKMVEKTLEDMYKGEASFITRIGKVKATYPRGVIPS